MKVEVGKKYRTKRGELVRRVFCVERFAPTLYPVVVEMENGEVQSYAYDGSYYDKTHYPSGRDLVEVCEWDDFKVDDKVMVRKDGDKYWSKRYFAGVNDVGKPTAFLNGCTSWSNNTSNHASWDKCRKPTEEELE